jgi:uncharacterized protein GlcG (DUF336 family)
MLDQAISTGHASTLGMPEVCAAMDRVGEVLGAIRARPCQCAHPAASSSKPRSAAALSNRRVSLDAFSGPGGPRRTGGGGRGGA